MFEFSSYRSYEFFASSVIGRWRFLRDAEQSEFLETVWSTSADRAEDIPAGRAFCRAQAGHDWKADEDDEGILFPSPFHAERMKPRAHRAHEGRANPKGIPFLYLATDEETAVAEVRPWIGSLVSVSQLRTRQTLRIVNCTTNDRRVMFYEEEPDAEERKRAVWRDIDNAFSTPVTLSDDVATYVPTQILAELFRARGLDGIGYRSSVGPGHNIALFNVEMADVINCVLVRIDELKLTYSEAANRYFVARHYPELKKPGT